MTATPHPHSDAAPRSVTVLGATGSVGRNALDLVGRGGFAVEALTAQDNVALLAELAVAHRARLAVIGNSAHYLALKSALAGTGVAAAAGAEAVTEAAARPCDRTISAIVGAAALLPTLAAIRRGGVIGLANKECLVCAGDLVTAEAARHGATLLPVDSEHNAILQAAGSNNLAEDLETLFLTASGGPFRTWTREAMAHVTPEQAVAHPNWSMGAKISVDSATMMNKGLEMIEAYRLFPVRPEQIAVLVHPQSAIHGMVQFRDGSIVAQMGAPDMRVPLAYALAWPERMATDAARLDLAKLGSLTFESPNETRFPALRLAREVLAEGGDRPLVLNAANEVAVAAFLAGKLGFLRIADVVEGTLSRLARTVPESIDAVLARDAEARDHARALCVD